MIALRHTPRTIRGSVATRGYCPEELDVSVFFSIGGLPVGLRLDAPSYSDERSGLGMSRAVSVVRGWLRTGFFCSAGSFGVSIVLLLTIRCRRNRCLLR